MAAKQLSIGPVTWTVCLAACLFGTFPSYGQFSADNSTLTEFRGRIVDVGLASSYNRLMVEVTNLDDNIMRQHVEVASDGSFAFPQLPIGDYQLRVLTLYGDEVMSEIVQVAQFIGPIEIRVPHEKLPKPVSGTVSLQELAHTPSKQVRKLLESGNRLLESRHFDEAEARFREAAKDDPDCPQAHADLGLTLARSGAWAEAAREYRAAIALDSGNSIFHTNLSSALGVLKQFDEAEVEARTALKLDPGNARAHFVLAAILLQKPEKINDAMRHLLAAQDTFPTAKATIEKICAAQRVEGCP